MILSPLRYAGSFFPLLLDPLQRRFRVRRMALLARTVGLTRQMRVLDVGGTIEIWQLAPVMPRVILERRARPVENRWESRRRWLDRCARPGE
jgi:hypothetical protein